MRTGLSITGPPIAGRMKTVKGEEQMSKIILLALADGDSLNPFNGDAGTRSPLFDINRPAARALLTRRVKVHFARWEAERRAKLSSIKFNKVGEGGDLEVEVRYIDLEADSEQEVIKLLKKGG